MELETQFDSLTAYVHTAEEGGYWAEVPALPGCLTQGETLDEVVVNLNDAIQGWLSVQTPEFLKMHGLDSTYTQDAISSFPPRVRILELAA